MAKRLYLIRKVADGYEGVILFEKHTAADFRNFLNLNYLTEEKRNLLFAGPMASVTESKVTPWKDGQGVDKFATLNEIFNHSMGFMFSHMLVYEGLRWELYKTNGFFVEDVTRIEE